MRHCNWLLMLVIVFTISCKKQAGNEPQSQKPLIELPPNSNYTMLKPGNYWIYERYVIDSDGIAKPINVFDSVYVEKDSTIADKTYRKIVNSGGPTTLLRDSLHYVVNHKGNIVFSPVDFTNIFRDTLLVSAQISPPPYDTIANVKFYMGDKDMQIATPAGTFKTMAFIKLYDMHPPLDKYGKKRGYYTRYAEGVGIVSETIGFYIQIPDVYENRLVRYKVTR